jgi:ADP-ribosylation factor GTPase-activating protein 2/3
MKVGGNASAKEFFTKHGGSTLLLDSDTKKKYSSRVAEVYKEELAKRANEDAIRYSIILTFYYFYSNNSAVTQSASS